MKEVIILGKIHVKMKSVAPPQKETKHIHASPADLYIQYLKQKISISANARSSHWRCSLKCRKVRRKLLCQRKHVNFAKFLRISFLQNNSRRMLLKCGHFNNEARDIDCICCRELDAMLYCFGQGSISPSTFYGYLPDLVTRISLIQLIT